MPCPPKSTVDSEQQLIKTVFWIFVLTKSAKSLAIGSVKSIGSPLPTKSMALLCPVVQRASGSRGVPEVCGAAGVRGTFRMAKSHWSAKSLGCEDSLGFEEFPGSEE